MRPSQKLRDDPIVEALIEARFTTPELQEVVVGRLSDIPLWRSTPKTRLASASIPEPVRQMNPALEFAPIVEIRDVPGIAAIRIGGNVLSLHFVHPYEGWENIFPRIESVMDATFQALPGLVISRLGLRYINVFTKSRHEVTSVHDLAVKLHVGDAKIDGPINVVFTSEEDDHITQARVASRTYLQGRLEADAVAAADIDVYTPNHFSCTTAAIAKSWIDKAHEVEKKAFRRLLPDALYGQLRSTVQ